MAGQTITEKVLSRQNVSRLPANAGDIIDARIDGLLCKAARLHNAYKRMGFAQGPPVVFDPDKVFPMNEHKQPPTDVNLAKANYGSKLDAQRLRIPQYYESEMGICHQILIDDGNALPGQLIVGDDSHTISLGALNAVATGIGNDEAAFVWAFGELYFPVPPTIKVNLHGKFKPYQFGKDIVLYLAGQYGDSFARDHAIEFGGPLASEMDMSSRFTIADHAVEVGATFGIFEADEKTEEYLRERTGKPFTPVTADPDAHYVKVIDIDCDSFNFQVAKPFRFDNVGPVEDVIGTKIDQARIGSCANGRFEDIEIAARMLEGRKVAPGVRFYISPSTNRVYKECAEAGLIEILLEAGVQFENPGCSICGYNVILNEEVAISSTTRNYHGRFGGAECSDAQVFLASPATVTAAAIAGEIVDPKEYLVA